MAPAADHRHYGGVQVLIVDDSALVRERLVEMLDDLADVHVAGQAASAAEAIAALPVLHPDFVILDVRMPDGDGLAVLQAAKHLDHAPIVAMFTNYPFPQIRQRCLDAGADFFWDKSRDFAEISAVLRQLTGAAGQ
jgi:DNA-binding NarL/FixJ family response regulator